MSEISERLDVTYLSPAEILPEEVALEWNIVSWKLSSSDRPCDFIKEIYNGDQHVFIVDTTSPHLYICEQAREALGFKDNKPKHLDIVYRDVAHSASISPIQGHFRDINLIGSDFLKTPLATIVIDYRNNEVTLEF